MTNFTEIAKYDAKRIEASKDKVREAQKIVAEINVLTYAQTNNPLTLEDKKKIIYSIRSYFLPSSPLRFGGSNNKAYLELVNYMMSLLGV